MTRLYDAFCILLVLWPGLLVYITGAAYMLTHPAGQQLMIGIATVLIALVINVLWIIAAQKFLDSRVEHGRYATWQPRR